MSYWTTTKNCEYCNEPFEASRSDAAYCGSRCRTANYRREQKRTAASLALEQWPDEAQEHLRLFMTEWCAGEPELLDLVIEHGDVAARDALVLAVHFMRHVSEQIEQIVAVRDYEIERLRKETAVLDEIRRLL